MINKIHDIVFGDRQLKMSDISEIVIISNERVFYILHKCLGIIKLAAKWVPRLLTLDQKRCRLFTSQLCLDMY